MDFVEKKDYYSLINLMDFVDFVVYDINVESGV